MQRILLMATLVFFAGQLTAQHPETIPSFARNPKPMSWYKTQQQAWDNELKQHPQNPAAWLNYFYVSRILMNHNDEVKLSDKQKEQQIDAILERMHAAIPESYEYNFCKWQSKVNDMAYYPYLEKAIAIDPNRTEHIDYMINISEIQGKVGQRDEYSRRKFDAGQLSAGLMYYNYNTLIGLEAGAILITAGDNDTYPAWALQERGIRRDVTVLNLFLLGIDEYRERIFGELHCQAVKHDSTGTQADLNKRILQSIEANGKNRPVYFALTASNCDNYLDSIQDNLYLAGLAYKFDTKSFDNMAMLRRNFEKNYALDYLDKAFYTETSQDRTKEINYNYLVPMLKLHEHYRMSGDGERDAWICAKIRAIAKDSEYEKDIENELKEQ